MALGHVQHVEAVAIIRELAASSMNCTVADAALAWCDENHPPPEAYIAAVYTLAHPDETDA